jgi:hypothetical protein
VVLQSVHKFDDDSCFHCFHTPLFSEIHLGRNYSLANNPYQFLWPRNFTLFEHRRQRGETCQCLGSSRTTGAFTLLALEPLWVRWPISMAIYSVIKLPSPDLLLCAHQCTSRSSVLVAFHGGGFDHASASAFLTSRCF